VEPALFSTETKTIFSILHLTDD